jgi:hypothetical protein
MKYNDESIKLEFALEKIERKIKKIFVEENSIPDTFRKFKHRLFKIAEREATKEILISRQRIGEPTVKWLGRVIHLVAAFENRRKSLFFIKETSLYKDSKHQIT